MARLRYLAREDIESIVYGLAGRLFPNYEDPLPALQLFGGLREGGALLESALALPRQPYYRRLHDKAGALLRSLIKNHPLVDGNKRVGMTATFVFLLMNGHLLIASNEEMVRFALEIAKSEPDSDWRDVARWLRDHSISVKEGKRSATRLLRQKSLGESDFMERLVERWPDIAGFVVL